MPKDKEFEDYTAPQQHLSVNEEVNSPRNSVNLSSRSSNKKGLSWLFGGKKVSFLFFTYMRYADVVSSDVTETTCRMAPLCDDVTGIQKHYYLPKTKK